MTRNRPSYWLILIYWKYYSSNADNSCFNHVTRNRSSYWLMRICWKDYICDKKQILLLANSDLPKELHEQCRQQLLQSRDKKQILQLANSDLLKVYYISNADNSCANHVTRKRSSYWLILIYWNYNSSNADNNCANPVTRNGSSYWLIRICWKDYICDKKQILLLANSDLLKVLH